MKGTICVLSLLLFGTAYGFSRFKREIPNGYGVNHPCPGKGHWDAVGHMNGGYTPQKNMFGQDFKAAGTRWTVDLCQKDSDGDGLTNGEELGDPQCKWRKRDSPPGPVRGHPGFCEPDRAKCDSGMTHDECPNPRATGSGRPRTTQRRLPPGANDHPQTFLQKNMDQGGIGQGPPGIGMGRDQGFGSPPTGFDSSFRGDSRFGSPTGGFDSSFRGDSTGPSFGLSQSGSQSFRPPTRPGFTSFSSGSGGEMFGAPGLSRDFGVSGGSGTGFTSGGGDFSIPQSQGLDRFRSSLDQRAIQGMGYPATRQSLTSSVSQFDIDRSVQARMDRERSRLGGSGVGFSGMGTSGMGTRGMSARDSRGMGTFGTSPFGMGPMGGGGMASMGGGGMASMGGGGGGMASMGGGGGGMAPMSATDMGRVGGGMGTDSMGSVGSGFSGRMESRYPPFMPMGGTPMSGPTFMGGMSMAGTPGMSRGSGGMMARRPFARF